MSSDVEDLWESIGALSQSYYERVKITSTSLARTLAELPRDDPKLLEWLKERVWSEREGARMHAYAVVQMADVLDADVRPLIDVPAALIALDQAYCSYGRGSAINVPTSIVIVPGGTQENYSYRQWDLRGSIPELGVSAVGIFSNVIDRTGTTSQIVELPYAKRCDWPLLYDLNTSALLAIIASDYCKQLRVSCTSALGMKHLARENASPLGILGSGSQAEAQLMAVPFVRQLDRVLVLQSVGGESRGLRPPHVCPLPVSGRGGRLVGRGRRAVGHAHLGEHRGRADF